MDCNKAGLDARGLGYQDTGTSVLASKVGLDASGLVRFDAVVLVY